MAESAQQNEVSCKNVNPAQALHISFLAIIFAIAYTQAPLYYSNQHQYFLHGLAWAGDGFLDQDWLANTADPTPVFSALVAFTARYLHVVLFYVYYLVLLGLYFASLVWLIEALPGYRLRGTTRLLFVTLLIGLHAAVLRLASARLFGVDYPWYFQSGLAGQYVLGFGLQPSAFGVLLIASLAAFAHHRPYLAAVSAAAAGIVHPTYLLPAGLLVLGYQACLIVEGRLRRAALAGGLALVLVLPVVVYSLSVFGPSSPEEFAQAEDLIVHRRIPHHTMVRQWCDGIAVAQLAWCVLGIVLVRRSRLFLVVVVPTVSATILTLVQVVTGSLSLALLFPWRWSAVLVPVATAVILAWLCRGMDARFRTSTAAWVGRAACGIALAGAVLGGILIDVLGLGYAINPQERPLLAHVREHRASGQVYLLPVRIPPVWTGHGSVSLNFTAPPRAGKSGAMIPVDLQGFRLETGVPIFVDFKAIPYKDVDVLEWYHRLELVEMWYQQPDWNLPGRSEALMRHGITHVVTTTTQRIRGDFLVEVYADEFYRIYQIKKEGP